MATRYAVANGNWSALATWDGGASLPGVGDDVYANGYTVTVDTDINIGTGKISTEVCPTTSIAGGRFACTTNRTLTCNIVAGTTGCFVPGPGNGLVFTINGNIYGGSAANAWGFGSNGFYNGTFYINGDIYGGSATTAYGLAVYNNSILFHQVGNMYGNTANAANLPYSAQIIVDGTITALSTAPALAATFANLGIFRFNGTITAATTVPAITITSNYVGTVVVNAVEVSVNGYPAISIQSSLVRKLYSNTFNSTLVMQHEDLSDFTMYASNAFDMPATTDVRNLVSYGAGAYIGTLAVPPAASVGIGVPVDNTVGTAAITATDMQNAILGKVAEAGLTIEDLIKAIASREFGKSAIIDLGGGNAIVKFRDLADTIDRIVGNMNGSERTSVTITP